LWRRRRRSLRVAFSTCCSTLRNISGASWVESLEDEVVQSKANVPCAHCLLWNPFPCSLLPPYHIKWQRL
jgi:hypothetical protein